MKEYLEETEIIDYKNKDVYALAMSLAGGCETDTQIAKSQKSSFSSTLTC